MPGRYFFLSSPEAARVHFGVASCGDFPARYNIAPTQPIALIRQGIKGREFALARWGFIPSWSKKPETRPLINARSETVREKPTFRAAFLRRRCLIPADGYYEWVQKGRAKQPYCIRPVDKGLFAFAGIWETAVDRDGGEIDTVAILTTDPGPDIRLLHHREGVVIGPEAYQRWLETDELGAPGLAGLFRHAPAGFWRAYETSTAVSKTGNDGPELIEPLARRVVSL